MTTIKIPIIKDSNVIKFKIFKLSCPLFLNVFNSPLSINYKNKNWEESKKIKGKIS